jgi:hypothetical protein
VPDVLWSCAVFPIRGTKFHDHVFNVRVERSAQRSGGVRRRAYAKGGSAESSLLVETRAHEVVRRRERIFRRALVAADLCAGLLVVGVAHRVFGASGPGVTAFALLPLIVVINTTSGLYRRDELLLRKNTLDEAPACSMPQRSPPSSPSWSRARCCAPPWGRTWWRSRG